jgi:hypothetical protein
MENTNVTNDFIKKKEKKKKKGVNLAHLGKSSFAQEPSHLIFLKQNISLLHGIQTKNKQIVISLICLSIMRRGPPKQILLTGAFGIVDTPICTGHFSWSQVLLMITGNFHKTMCVENHKKNPQEFRAKTLFIT